MCLLSDVTIPRKADRALRVSSSRLHVGPKATLATWFSYGVQLVLRHGGYSCQNPSIFPTYEFVGYPYDEKPAVFPPPFKARMSFSYEIRAVATNFEGLEPLRKKRQNKSFVQRTLGGLSRHLLCERMKIVGN